MIRRILVPLDGSAMSEAILPEVVRLVRRRESEVVLVSAEPPVVTEDSALIATVAPEGATEYLLAIRERLEARHVRARILEQRGTPTDVILRVAREQRASMIAMATHGRTGLTRLILGSVAEEVLRRSPVPVFLVRPSSSYELAKAVPEEDPLRRILVPVDGSGLQGAVVPHALAFAKRFEARVVLLRVLEPMFEKDTRGFEEELETARHALREVAFAVAAAGVPCLTLLEEGGAAKTILSITRAHEIDLIAMATHGRRGISRLVSGSVTEEVLRDAPVPMLIVNGGRISRGRTPRSRERVSRR
ncbi:MAG TPA: universal stress protein [Planctomycetota bacterium]|nr:universal stress protein [Planctomycetota bacterium]